MDRLVNVRLRDTGQNFVYNAHDLEVKENDYVIVEHDRGLDYGQVVSLKPEVEQPERGQEEGAKRDGAQSPAQEEAPGRARAQSPGQEEAPGRARAQSANQKDDSGRASGQVKRIIRVAKENDLKQIEDNRARSREAFSTCQKKIAEHKLDMKLVQAEYAFDRSKIIFYFTSGGRVDFRDLVKDLAKIFKARIELRQIGVRDEAKFFGGFGPCGRELCCATFLKDFEPVTIKMAKEEGLPLNPPKISGICGRLMCCLNYEYETYKFLSKGLPREGERITTAEGKGKVINVNVFKRSATVEMEDGKFVEISYKEKSDGTCECTQCPCAQAPERAAHHDVRTARPERGERPGRKEFRNERPDRGRPDQRGERQERGGRQEQRPERPGGGGRHERQDRHGRGNRNERFRQQRQGQERPQGPQGQQGQNRQQERNQR